MCSKSSDTIAREQQIREITHNRRKISPTSTARIRSGESQTYEIIIIVILHIIFAVFILGRFAINNGPLIREVYYALTDTSNETPSFFEKFQ